MFPRLHNDPDTRFELALSPVKSIWSLCHQVPAPNCHCLPRQLKLSPRTNFPSSYNNLSLFQDQVCAHSERPHLCWQRPLHLPGLKQPRPGPEEHKGQHPGHNNNNNNYNLNYNCVNHLEKTFEEDNLSYRGQQLPYSRLLSQCRYVLLHSLAGRDVVRMRARLPGRALRAQDHVCCVLGLAAEVKHPVSVQHHQPLPLVQVSSQSEGSALASLTNQHPRKIALENVAKSCYSWWGNQIKFILKRLPAYVFLVNSLIYSMFYAISLFISV